MEKILDMRFDASGKKEYLVQWSGTWPQDWRPAYASSVLQSILRPWVRFAFPHNFCLLFRWYHALLLKKQGVGDFLADTDAGGVGGGVGGAVTAATSALAATAMWFITPPTQSILIIIGVIRNCVALGEQTHLLLRG